MPASMASKHPLSMPDDLPAWTTSKHRRTDGLQPSAAPDATALDSPPAFTVPAAQNPHECRIFFCPEETVSFFSFFLKGTIAFTAPMHAYISPQLPSMSLDTEMSLPEFSLDVSMSDPNVFTTAEPELPTVTKRSPPLPSPSLGLSPPDHTTSSLIGINRSLARLDATLHGIWMRISAEERSDKGTADAYSRRVRDYVMWWDQYQHECSEQEECWTVVPAFPVTATKAALFVNHKKTHKKRKPGSTETIPSSNVGKSVIQQVVSALEDWRTLESAAKHNEPKRADTVQTLKASGASYDAYTTEELVHCSWWSLTQPSGACQVFIGLRDQTMVLLGATTALRGESLHMLQLSDLFVSSAFLDSILSGRAPALQQVLTALADNAKTNQHSRVDEHGTLHHRLVELCPVGSLAMLLYAYFHVISQPVPDFAPQFGVPGFGEFGYWPWYELFVFWADDPKKQMSYDSEISQPHGSARGRYLTFHRQITTTV
ncbi:hypothetical protein F4604DRAFT_1692867 [Suillus subluteus]|nr:hypothetical protein F4604DRAFT_1692867 [Suillus subluteus]